MSEKVTCVQSPEKIRVPQQSTNYCLMSRIIIMLCNNQKMIKSLGPEKDSTYFVKIKVKVLKRAKLSVFFHKKSSVPNPLI